jgi:uncharacterized membrane protein YedE/YeeE
MNGVLAFVCGVIFAAGVSLSGMVRPSKVLGFLDFGGKWDPSLAFVMVGALAVFAGAWMLVKRVRAPMLGGSFPGAPPSTIDARLVGGSALFGLGWGLGGWCPGPALVSIGSGLTQSLVFVGAMALGMVIYQLADRHYGRVDEGTTF